MNENNLSKTSKGQRESFNLVCDDGQVTFSAKAEAFETTDRLTAGKPNGLKRHTFVFNRTKAEAADGLGFSYKGLDGKIRTGQRVQLVIDDRDPVEIEEARKMTKIKKTLTNIRKRSGLVTSKSPVPESQKMTLQDVRNFANGETHVDGVHVDDLEVADYDKLLELIDKLEKKQVKRDPLQNRINELILQYTLETENKLITPDIQARAAREAHEEAEAKADAKRKAEAAKTIAALTGAPAPTV